MKSSCTSALVSLVMRSAWDVRPQPLGRLKQVNPLTDQSSAFAMFNLMLWMTGCWFTVRLTLTDCCMLSRLWTCSWSLMCLQDRGITIELMSSCVVNRSINKWLDVNPSMESVNCSVDKQHENVILVCLRLNNLVWNYPWGGYCCFFSTVFYIPWVVNDRLHMETSEVVETLVVFACTHTGTIWKPKPLKWFMMTYSQSRQRCLWSLSFLVADCDCDGMITRCSWWATVSKQICIIPNMLKNLHITSLL